MQPDYNSPINMAAITTYIHHPLELAPVAEDEAPPPMQMMLTEKERKKIKRMKKVEKAKEIQDKIRLGLIAAPEPKMRLSNLMRVLGNEGNLFTHIFDQDFHKAYPCIVHSHYGAVEN